MSDSIFASTPTPILPEVRLEGSEEIGDSTEREPAPQVDPEEHTEGGVTERPLPDDRTHDGSESS